MTQEGPTRPERSVTGCTYTAQDLLRMHRACRRALLFMSTFGQPGRTEPSRAGDAPQTHGNTPLTDDAAEDEELAMPMPESAADGIKTRRGRKRRQNTAEP